MIGADSAGGYIVKYDLTTSAKAEYFGTGVEGKVTFHYAVTDVNQPAAIALPPDCPPGLVDVQPLPDATDVTSTPGALSFTTATSAADAAAFYQSEIPKWNLPHFGSALGSLKRASGAYLACSRS